MTEEEKKKKSNERAAKIVAGIAFLGMIGCGVYGYNLGYNYGLNCGVYTGVLHSYNTLISAFPDKKEEISLALIRAKE